MSTKFYTISSKGKSTNKNYLTTMLFKDCEVTFEKLSITKINEAAELIQKTYEADGIWSHYSAADACEELMASFSNLIYRPIFFLAIHEGKIIGLASYMWSHCSTNVFELTFGTVHPDFQRKGIGQHLTYLRLKEIVDDNADALIITVARRPKLFEKFNFKSVCKIQNELVDSDFMVCKSVDVNFDTLN